MARKRVKIYEEIVKNDIVRGFLLTVWKLDFIVECAYQKLCYLIGEIENGAKMSEDSLFFLRSISKNIKNHRGIAVQRWFLYENFLKTHNILL